MIELERHIEVLLLDNDCVTVPGLGGFVAHYLKARYDDEDKVFLPPLRTIGFNSKLNINDSLLAQSYVEAYDISYPEATNRIETEVDGLLKALKRDGRYEIAGIGTLSFNENGNYEFQPCEAGLLTPELYGLYSFEMKPGVGGDAVVVESPPIADSEEDVVEEERGDAGGKTISIRVSWLRNIAAVAIAIFAFFIISPPIGENSSELAIMNFDESVLFRLMPKDVTLPVKDTGDKNPCAEAVADTVRSDVKAVCAVDEGAMGKAQESGDASKSVESYYTIVLASKVSSKNAEDYVARLHKDGVSEAFVHKSKSNVVRVLCGRFQTEGEAYGALNRRHSDDVFSQGWIYKVEE